jgi:hypothetical protein
MPEKLVKNYAFSGPTEVMIYSQAEMAQALGVSERRLVEILIKGEAGLCYHAHPLATGGDYEFNKSSYVKNTKVWACLLTNGAHDYKPDPKYDYLPGITLTCDKCGHIAYP